MPVFLLAAALAGIAAPPVPTGAARFGVEVSGRKIVVLTYKPAGYRDGPLILVFHGLWRNAEDYRDRARGLADRSGALIAAPEFDEERFPYRKFTRGGILREDGSIAPRADWTWELVPEIAEALRRREGRPDAPYYLIGHSAGGQFVDRLNGFVAPGARGSVSANPGSYLLPTRDEPFPYGFGGLPDDLADDAAIGRYLARPLTIYLGTDDVRRDDDLDTSPEADRQGRTRLERGRATFEAARALAERRGWTFGWRLVEARGIGHDALAMLEDPACLAALFGPADVPTPRKVPRESSP